MNRNVYKGVRKTGIVIAGVGLYDFNNSNYTVINNDADVKGSHVSSHGDGGGAGSSGTSQFYVLADKMDGGWL